MNISLNNLVLFLALALCSTVVISCQQQHDDESNPDTIQEVANSPEYAELRAAIDDEVEYSINNKVDVEAFVELFRNHYDRLEDIPDSIVNSIQGGEHYVASTSRLLAAQKALEDRYQFNSLLVDYHEEIKKEYLKANGGRKVFLPPAMDN